MRRIQAESENTWKVNVRGPNRGGLERRELSPGIIARFATKYSISKGCWLWTAGKFRNGYGMFNIGRDVDGRQHTTYAHRIAFVWHHRVGIPAGAVVMHTCDVPACVNPAHLVLGTQAQNIADATSKGKYDRPRVVGSVRWKRQQRRKVA